MMPSQLLMDPRSMSLDDVRFPPETRAGFWNPSAPLNQQGHDLEKTSNLSWRFAEQSLVTNSNKTYNSMEGQDENSLFSSSLSDLFTKNCKFSSNNAQCRQPAHVDEEGSFESLKEIEAHTIGNLLPDDKDLLSGVNYDLEPYIASDIEDADIFSSGGGMELVEDQDGLSRGRPIAGEHPSAERPSRTLFVTNISSNLEDAELKDLFEKYGDIQTLNTTCKQRGFVTVSYYDIRAACDAMRSLQDKPLRRRNLDIHFSIPKDNPVETDIYEGALVVHNLDFPVSNDDLHQIFGLYGEIKEIRENPYRHHKFIEFYDVRAAQAALRALKRSDISEKQIRVEPSRTRQCLVQLSSPELEQGQSIAYFQQGSPPDSTIGAIGPVFNGAISSGCMENGTAQSMHSSFENRLAIRQLVENGLHQSLPPSGPHRSPSMSLAHLGNTCRLGEPSLNLENIEFSFQGRPLFDPHTLPEYRDGLACGVPYSSPGIRPTSISSRAREVTTNEHIHSVDLNGNALEPNDSVLGSGNGSCPLHGQQYMWNNTNLYQHHPSNPLMWPNVPSYMNGMHVHPWQDVHAHCPSTASHMLNSVLPRQHHMGSSPTLDPFLWQRRHVYEGDSHETSEFHPGSFGNTALSGDSSLHQLELNSFPHHLVDLPIASANVGLHSSGKRYHMLPCRHSMINMANSFDGSNERVVSRRSEVTSSLADSKKPYDLNIDLISRGEDSRTTLMIKNIPNKYTSKMLLAAIDEHHRGTYNFIYLPIDFKNKCNVGYAFINMINPSQIVPFYQAFNGKKWEKFNSEKVASLAYARIQGKAALIAHFQNSSLMNEDKRCRPILFHSDGPNAGDQEPFPLGVNIRSRPGKHQTSSNEENHQESTLNCDNGENAFNIMDSSSSSVRDSE